MNRYYFTVGNSRAPISIVAEDYSQALSRLRSAVGASSRIVHKRTVPVEGKAVPNGN